MHPEQILLTKRFLALWFSRRGEIKRWEHKAESCDGGSREYWGLWERGLE